MQLDPAHRAVIRKETWVSLALNSLLPAGVMWLTRSTPPTTLWGAEGLLVALLPAAGAPTFLMTLGLTIALRARLRAGVVAHRAASGPRLLAALRRRLPWRAAMLAVMAILLLVPLGIAVASLPGVMPMTQGGHVAFSGAFGALVGLTMTPLIVLAALSDRTS